MSSGRFAIHFEELGFDEECEKGTFSKILIYEFFGNSSGDWMHINSMSTIGPNKFYDKGDERFPSR